MHKNDKQVLVERDNELTIKQRRFMGPPLFPLLLWVNAAGAAASWGRKKRGDRKNAGGDYY